VSAVGYFRAQARNNAWANHRLLTACSNLSAAEFMAVRMGFFPSIMLTWNHILTVDWFYVSCLEGACIGPAAYDPVTPCSDFFDLNREQRAVDARLIVVCDSMADADLSRREPQVRKAGTSLERMDATLLHLFQHQVHHRGQIHTMLSETSVAPPQLDEFFLDMDADVHAEDFAALGLTDAGKWR